MLLLLLLDDRLIDCDDDEQAEDMDRDEEEDAKDEVEEALREVDGAIDEDDRLGVVITPLAFRGIAMLPSPVARYRATLFH